ncbi:blaR1 [Symbiodinium microadriaticum]|nr:blaR1 [Symbiodinium microadriaticum]
MQIEILSSLISIFQSNLYLIVLVADFLLKSACLVLLVFYFEQATSPYFSNSQKFWLWLAALLLLSLLPLSTNYFEALLARIPGEPELTLFTLLVPAEQAERSLTAVGADKDIYQFLLAAYAFVLTVHLLKLAASFLHVAKLNHSASRHVPEDVSQLLAQLAARANINRSVTLAYSSQIDSPVTFGTLKPTVLIPENMRCMKHEVLESVLIHELCHIKRCDQAIYAAAYLLAALNWFNPFVWIALKRLGLESEYACDSEVVAYKGKILALGDEDGFSSETLRLVHSEVPDYPQAAIERAYSAEFSLSPALKSLVIENVVQQLEEKYVFPDRAAVASNELQQRFNTGYFDEIDDPQIFANRIVGVLDVINDWHLWVNYYADPIPDNYDYYASLKEEDQRARLRRRNFGIERLERLTGNVGLIEFREFGYLESESETALVHAMELLSNTSGLIIDLRRNGGGSPDMVSMVASYFLEPGHHIGTIVYREGGRQEESYTRAPFPELKLSLMPYKREVAQSWLVSEPLVVPIPRYK